MIKKAVLIHGFNVRDKGAGSIDNLAPYLVEAGYSCDVDEGDYGYFGLLSIRLIDGERRRQVIYRLAQAICNADLVVAHSNGANFLYQALKLMPRNREIIVVLIAPALDPDTPIPDPVKRQLVLCSRRDIWVRLSSYLLFHPWGRMGAVGYQLPDPRNVNYHDNTRRHSQWIKPKYVAQTWLVIKTFIEAIK